MEYDQFVRKTQIALEERPDWHRAEIRRIEERRDELEAQNKYNLQRKLR